jgi:Protein of unknown function (DUF3226)
MPIDLGQITKPKLLLGEGVDEVRFFGAYLAHLNITDIQVAQYAGKSRLAAFLQTLVTPIPGFSGLVSLGITRDADDNPTGAFQSVSAALQSARLPVPAAHGQSAGSSPRVHVFILPDGITPGMLESLCLESVRGNSAFPCLTSYFQCVLRAAARQPTNVAKAFLHAWLASEVIPDKRLGEAAEAGYWPWGSPAFNELKGFLTSL